ncbi:hypothetical protein JR316_0005019 [Psilocybe cubensis]|uniref:Uncharacterized protein n=1 Tax=Psilocybe cubensis TaxID=181762 RepID=A0ACB8H4Z8_PSICU|nr:hypothetical protein JR316_0005019 [Psilocybe cubensis]KAH9482919.1 hypothetical protein JR316_0005019 [Psilocybe cubensis]
MAPLFSFLKNSKTNDRGNHETIPLQSHTFQDMGSIGSKRKLKKPGPNRAATNISNINPVENLGLDTSPLAPKISSHHGDPETRSTRRMQQDLLQRSTFPPPYTPSHVQDEPSNHPQMANSIISGHFFSEGSRYPQFTPSQARSFTVPSVRRTSFPDVQTYDEQIEDESWVNNQTQSSHNLAAQMRDTRISGAPTGATIGQDDTFYNHEPSGEQPVHTWRDETEGGPFGVAMIDENAVRRQNSHYSNHPQQINGTSSRRQASVYSHGSEEFPDIVTRRLRSQQSNQPIASNDFVASRPGSIGSNRSKRVQDNITSRHGSHRSNRPQDLERFTANRQASLRSNHLQDAPEKATSRNGSHRSNQPQHTDGFIPSRHGSIHSNGHQENEKIVTERLGSQRSNSPREIYEIIPSENGSLRSSRSQIDEPGVVLRRLGSQGDDQPQEMHETIHSRQGSLRSNRPQETNTMFTRLGTQQSLQPEETHDTDSRRNISLRSSRPQELDDVANRRFGSRRSRRAQTMDESTGRRRGSQRSNLPPQSVQAIIASRQRSHWAQPPETIEPDVFERDYGTESEYEPEIYNYIVPAGLNVVFQDEDGNVITRVGRKGIPYEANRPVRSAPIIVHDEFGRELYRTKNLSSPPKVRPDLFNSHVKNRPAWEGYSFGSGGRIGTHDSGQNHRKSPNINRERAQPIEPPFHDISYRAQINYA